MNQVNTSVEVRFNSNQSYYALVDTGNRAKDLIDYDIWKTEYPDCTIDTNVDMEIALADTTQFLTVVGRPKRTINLSLVGLQKPWFTKPLIVKNLSSDFIFSADTIAKIPIIPDLSKNIAMVGPKGGIIPLIDKTPGGQEDVPDGSVDEDLLDDQDENAQFIDTVQRKVDGDWNMVENSTNGPSEDINGSNGPSEDINGSNGPSEDINENGSNGPSEDINENNQGKVKNDAGISRDNAKEQNSLIPQIEIVSELSYAMLSCEKFTLGSLESRVIPVRLKQPTGDLPSTIGLFSPSEENGVSGISHPVEVKIDDGYWKTLVLAKNTARCSLKVNKDQVIGSFNPIHQLFPSGDASEGTSESVNCAGKTKCTTPFHGLDPNHDKERYFEIIAQYAGIPLDKAMQSFTESAKTEIDELFNHQITQNDVINEDLKEIYLFLFSCFRRILAKDRFDSGVTDLIKYNIDTGDSPPISHKCRPLNPKIHQDWLETATKWQENGIMEPTESPWSSPLVPVKKKDGTTRFATDYRRLNEVTKFDAFPIPNMISLLSSDNVRNARYFLSWDLSGAYLAIPCTEATADKLTIVGPNGLFRMMRMPFGSKNSAQCYNRLMTLLFEKQWNLFHLLSYFDDHVIPVIDDEHGLFFTLEFLQKINKGNLRISPKKCTFFKKQINFLGHKIGEGSLAPAERLVETVMNWPTPMNVRDLLAFIGTSSYYRRYIRNFAGIAKPMTALLKKNKEWKWTQAEDEAFQTIKSSLVNKPVLMSPDFDKPFELYCDASDFAVGGVLSQRDDNNQEHPIGYFSKTLNKHEVNYAITKKELLAVVLTVENFAFYLNKPFLIYTDHRALTYLMKSKVLVGQLFRWQQRLLDHSFEIVAKPGTQLKNADGLSRMVKPPKKDLELTNEDVEMLEQINGKKTVGVTTRSQTKKSAQRMPKTVKVKFVDEEEEIKDLTTDLEPTKELVVEPEELDQPNDDEPDTPGDFGKCWCPEDLPVDYEDLFSKKKPPVLKEKNIKRAIKNDECLRKIILWKEENHKPSTEQVRDSPEMIQYKKIWSKLKVKDGKLYCQRDDTIFYQDGQQDPCKIEVIVIPKSLRSEGMYTLHAGQFANHPGISKTYSQAKRIVYWPNLQEDLATFITGCSVCIKAKERNLKNNVPMGQGGTKQIRRLMTWYCDIVGPFPNTDRKNRYILTFVDAVTKYMEFDLLNEITAEKVTESILKTLVMRYGIGLTLITDNGRQFIANILKDCCESLGIVQSQTLAYNPRANLVERYHKTLETHIRSGMIQNDAKFDEWDLYTPYAVMAMNQQHLISIPSASPHLLVFGENPVLDIDKLLEEVKEIPNNSPSIDDMTKRFRIIPNLIREQQERNHQRNKKYFDKKVKPDVIESGDYVYVWTPNTTNAKKAGYSRKLIENYDGPYQVIKKINDYTVVIRKGRGLPKVNIRRCRKVPYSQDIPGLVAGRRKSLDKPVDADGNGSNTDGNGSNANGKAQDDQYNNDDDPNSYPTPNTGESDDDSDDDRSMDDDGTHGPMNDDSDDDQSMDDDGTHGPMNDETESMDGNEKDVSNDETSTSFSWLNE